MVGFEPTWDKPDRFSYHYSFHCTYYYVLWSGLCLYPRLYVRVGAVKSLHFTCNYRSQLGVAMSKVSPNLTPFTQRVSFLVLKLISLLRIPVPPHRQSMRLFAVRNRCLPNSLINHQGEFEPPIPFFRQPLDARLISRVLRLGWVRAINTTLPSVARYQ